MTAWGERPEDVLLCLDPRCRMAYGHDGECDIPPGEGKPDA